MRVATREPLFDLDGRPIRHPTGEPASFASIVIPTLIERMPEDRPSVALSFIAIELARKIRNNSQCDLTDEEARMIRRRVAAFTHYNNLIITLIMTLLDPPAAARETAGEDEHNIYPIRGGAIEEV